MNQQNMYGNMQNPNMMPFGMNIGNNNFNQFMNFGGNQNLLNIYNIGNNQQQNINQGNSCPLFEEYINLVFKTTGGLITNLNVKRGTPVFEALSLYLKRVGKPELFNPNSGIFFLYNARKINLYDNTNIENFLKVTMNPTIMVNDDKNLIGA